jgi:hypothetical protein
MHWDIYLDNEALILYRASHLSKRRPINAVKMNRKQKNIERALCTTHPYMPYTQGTFTQDQIQTNVPTQPDGSRCFSRALYHFPAIYAWKQNRLSLSNSKTPCTRSP